MSTLDAVKATNIIHHAISIGAFQGAMPEADGDKITEAGKLVELARQQMAVVQHIGEANVPPANLTALRAVLAEAGYGPDGQPLNGTANGNGAAAPAPAPVQQPEPQATTTPPAPTPDPAPVPPAMPQPPAAMASVVDAVPAPPPPQVGPSEPQQAPAPPAPPAPPVAAAQPTPYEETPTQYQQPAPPPAAAPTPQEPVSNEVWLDADGNQWEVVQGSGGPQVEARSLSTGEMTVLPSGFLKQRVSGQAAPAPQAQPAPATVPQPPAAPQPVAAPTPPPVPTPTPEPAPSPSPSPSAQPASPPPASASPSPSPETVPTPPAPTSSAPSGAASPAPSSPSSPPSPSSTESSSSDPEAEWAAREQHGVDHPEQQPRHADQELAIPVDDHEGDAEYEKVLERVAANYSPEAMPAPMDLEKPPAGMPEDLTEVTDIQARAYHSQFNALAARARFLAGLERAKSRAIKRIIHERMKHAMREARGQLGKDASVTEVTHVAEDHESVARWIEREALHADRAEAYETFFRFYTENVTVLSRDWTMRDREEKGS